MKITFAHHNSINPIIGERRRSVKSRIGFISGLPVPFSLSGQFQGQGDTFVPEPCPQKAAEKNKSREWAGTA